MGGYRENSEWDRRFAGSATVRELLDRVIGGDLPLEQLMKRYRRLVLGYARWLVARDKAADPDAASAEVWKELMAAMPERLTRGWLEKGGRFRDLLREAVHQAHFAWSNPARAVDAVSRRILPDADSDMAWRTLTRADVLARAKERLRLYNRENEARGSVYYTVFCIWDEDHEARHAAIGMRLATVTGRELSPANLRKTLRRALGLFGRYVSEEVEELMALPITADSYREIFEELDLTEYAMKSSHCRGLMGLDIYE